MEKSIHLMHAGTTLWIKHIKSRLDCTIVASFTCGWGFGRLVLAPGTGLQLASEAEGQRSGGEGVLAQGGDREEGELGEGGEGEGGELGRGGGVHVVVAGAQLGQLSLGAARVKHRHSETQRDEIGTWQATG